MADASRLAGDQLREIAVVSKGTVQIHDETTGSSGSRQFDLSIRFDGLERAEGGLRVRAREPFQVVIPRTFPFDHPVVATPHVRFSGFGHVQWRRVLCLYRSSADWRPEDGMHGFIKRLDAWIRDAARNNLDPNDAPLHPPVAYPTVDRLIVPIADTPLVGGSPWFGLAELRERNRRTEIIGWTEHDQQRRAVCTPAILLYEALPFEYPATVHALLQELESYGIDYGRFIFHLARQALQSRIGNPLTVVLGTPMRRVVPDGRALQHLAVWEISADDADKLRQLNIAAQVGETAQWTDAVKAVVKWSVSAEVGWCRVSEMRPEVTQRRDQSSPMAWFRGKRVAIWGCGAIGTHVAESVVRSGARSVELVDNKSVIPGLLVRQGFEDADIGRNKACALSERLKRIAPDLETVVSTDDLIASITVSNPLPSVDLVIDCTASLAVRTALERVLRDVDPRPAIASMAIDSHAGTGAATLSTPEHSGGTLDLVRRLKLEACRTPQLSQPLEAFWPSSTPSESFQPEPGCSEPTFIGSNADLAGLSARMLNSVARAIAEPGGGLTGAGWLFEESGPVHTFRWLPDRILRNDGLEYSVRVCRHAEREMSGWARRSVRMAGTTIETGGLVFGEWNEAAGVLWVTDVEGPPPDSDAAEDHFTCGTEGMEAAAKKRHSRFRGSVDCVGSWHTHPTSTPHPSTVDISAVAQLLGGPGSSRRACLILILSGSPDKPVLGAHAFRAKLAGKNHTFILPSASATVRLGTQPERPRNVGIALSGGGSRAIAFHLGCLRALHDLDLLGRVQILSSVSGGSIIAAMYAYSSDSFSGFDTSVRDLLSRGLQCDILREMVRPQSIWKFLQNHFVAGVSFLFRVILRLLRVSVQLSATTHNNPSRLRCTFNRTEALRNVLAKSLFGDTHVHEVSRSPLQTVISATELRTGSAFRFGSQQSGCWRYGTIPIEDALVADAVAASAAYPAFLPALERQYHFTKNGRTTNLSQVLLTDGGVFDNLGVSPMEPGRTPLVSTNVFCPDYIICCDAGAGLFDDDRYPLYWPSRMYRSLLTVYRKVQDSTRKRLHELANAGEIRGFALCYLGQQDDSLPWVPAGLPRRAEVRDYPTDLAAMSTEDIDCLALRGELLMRFLVSYYLPEL